MTVEVSRNLGAGLAVISIGGSGIGIGIIFAGLLHGVCRNPATKNHATNLAMIGFALCESIALFGLLVTFLILFGSVN